MMKCYLFADVAVVGFQVCFVGKTKLEAKEVVVVLYGKSEFDFSRR